MSVSRGRSRKSRASPSQRRKSSSKIGDDQRMFLLKLLHVLAEIVDERGHKEVEDEGAMDAESGSEENRNDEMSVLRIRADQGTKENKKREEDDEIRHVTRFRKLCENHGQLTHQIQISLNAIGGGGRTAKALQRTHEEVNRLSELFYDDDGKMDYFKPSTCMEIYVAYKEAASDVVDAFKELGVFKKSFFDTIERIVRHLEVITARLNVEYGPYAECLVDLYVDSVFEPLIKDFDVFIYELTNIAEKEIAAIRQSQNFTSQRYLNLTTVATFLSSVTATTLQITADDSGSPLTSITNTLWFISLVFSTASAVYSLLVMTWRQSSICQPDLSLPFVLNIWFRNGPMYALIAAVITFSIGLCLLAFHVADQQGGFASAAIPTAFASIHAYYILLFSTWFLFEQWKTRHMDSWVKVRDRYIVPITRVAKKIVGSARDRRSRIVERTREPITAFKTVKAKFRRSRRSSSETLEEKDLSDVESGRTVPTRMATPTPNAVSLVESEEPRSRLSYDIATASQHSLEAANLENTLATPNEKPASLLNDTNSNEEGTSDKSTEEDVTFEPFEEVLQFSPDGRFLASAHSDTVTIYDTHNLFTVFRTVKAPGAVRILQVAWNPNDLVYGPYGPADEETELLVRSLEGLSAWNITLASPDAHMVGHLTEVTGPVHWIGLDDAGIIGFVTSTESSIKLFDRYCKEVPDRSIDVSKIRKIDRVIDATFFQNKYVFCLARTSDPGGDSLLVINLNGNKVESARTMNFGHTRMILSQASKSILFLGSENGAEVARLSISNPDDALSMSIGIEYCVLWWATYAGHEIDRPERAVAFHGNNDGMMVGYSSGEIVTLHELQDSEHFSSLHNFTARTEEAIPRNPVSFAVNAWWESRPYLFAFGDKHGSVMVWSIQSNKQLSGCNSARTFYVEDRRGRRTNDPIVLPGRYLVLSPRPVS